MEQRKIQGVHILLTDACNFNCKYCFVNKRPKYMSKYTLLKTLDFLIDSNVCNESITLQWFGGEPMLAFDLMIEGIDYADALAKEKGIKLSHGMVTNGSLLNVSTLAELNKRKVGMLISYDGRYTHDQTRQDGTQQLVAKNIQLAIAMKSRVSVAVQVMHKHTHNLYANILDLAHMGVKSFALNPVVHGGMPPLSAWDFKSLAVQMPLIADLIFQKKMAGESFEWGQLERHVGAVRGIAIGSPASIARQSSEDWSCGACKGSIAIDVEGYIVPCHHMPTGTCFDQWVLGHVFEGEIDADLRKEFLKDTFPECKDCAVQVCASCRAINKHRSGDELEITTESCAYQRLVWETAIVLHNRLEESKYYDGKNSPRRFKNNLLDTMSDVANDEGK